MFWGGNTMFWGGDTMFLWCPPMAFPQWMYVLRGSCPGRRGCDGAADDAALRALAGAGVGMGALAAHGQSLAVAQAAVAAQVHQALDVQAHLAAEVALDLVVLVEALADAVDLVVGQVLGPLGRIDLGQGTDLPRAGVADPVQVRERDLDLLLAGKVDSGKACHSLSLPLLVARIRGADHAHHALAADHLALHADLPDRSADLHDFLQLAGNENQSNNRAFRALPRRTPTAASRRLGPPRREWTGADNRGTAQCQGRGARRPAGCPAASTVPGRRLDPGALPGARESRHPHLHRGREQPGADVQERLALLQHRERSGTAAIVAGLVPAGDRVAEQHRVRGIAGDPRADVALDLLHRGGERVGRGGERRGVDRLGHERDRLWLVAALHRVGDPHLGKLGRLRPGREPRTGQDELP